MSNRVFLITSELIINIVFILVLLFACILIFLETKKIKKREREESSRSPKQSPQQHFSDPRRELATGIFTIINRQVCLVMEQSLPEASILNYFDLWAGIYSCVQYMLEPYLISITVLNVFASHVVSISKKQDFNKVKNYISTACDQYSKFFEIFSLTTDEMLNDPDYTDMYFKLVFASIDSPPFELTSTYAKAILNTQKQLSQFL